MSTTLIPDDLREAVIKRDGSRCLKCKVQCTWSGPTRLHIDHIVPEARGGQTVLSNLQVLCRTCNLRKGTATRDYRTATSRRSERAKAAYWQRRLNQEWADHMAKEKTKWSREMTAAKARKKAAA